jgi:hypothetical protein
MRTWTALLLAMLASANLTAQKMTAPQLITLAQSHSPALQEAINATFTQQDLAVRAGSLRTQSSCGSHGLSGRRIPVMICVFINPGDVTDAPGTLTYRFVQAYADQWRRTLKDSMRSTEYDTVSDRYDRFLRDELLPQVTGQYDIRNDAYSRAIAGSSSGGICAFNAAWQMPDQFSRVIRWIGSFTSIQWKEDPAIPDGVRIIRRKSCASRHAISAYRYRTAPTIRRTIAMEAGRSLISGWSTPLS